MREKLNRKFPYQSLGIVLRRMREKKRQSLVEVSGAVEIDVTMLTDIEQGAKRPSEDILLLLISHFALKDDDANKLWELAGYIPKDLSSGPGRFDEAMPAVFVLPLDSRIVYTDMVHILVNEHGVTMNFMQSGGPANKPLAVSRVGMSREHARDVLGLLQRALQDSQPKLLPAPESGTSEPEDLDPNSEA